MIVALACATANAQHKNGVFTPFEHAAMNPVCRQDLPVLHGTLTKIEESRRIPKKRIITCVPMVGEYSLQIVCDYETQTCVTSSAEELARDLERRLENMFPRKSPLNNRA
jgi:hypothetical protein